MLKVADTGRILVEQYLPNTLYAGWRHYCGVQHALQAVSEAMEGCTKPSEPVIDLDALKELARRFYPALDPNS